MTRWIRIAAALLAGLACGCIAHKPVLPVIKSVTAKNHSLYIERCMIVRGDHELQLTDCRVEQVRIGSICTGGAAPGATATPRRK